MKKEKKEAVKQKLLNKVEICGVNTSRLKVLTDDEKTELLRRMKEGDADARAELISGNLKLVLSVIRRFAGRTGDPDDLFQVGCVGLIKAVDHFDVSQNVKFSTYAVPMIIGEVKRYLRDNNMIRVSRSVRDLAYKALWEKERLSASLGRDPTPEEICEALNNGVFSGEGAKKVSVRELNEALDAVVDPVSLYDPVYSEGSDSLYLMDQIKDDNDEVENWMMSCALREAASTLGEREQKILKLRYYLGRTQTEVASEIGISQAQVSRLEKSALETIRRRI